MKSHSWLILLVVLCTTQVLAKPQVSTPKGVEDVHTTKATNIVKTSVTDDLRYFSLNEGVEGVFIVGEISFNSPGIDSYIFLTILTF